MIQCLGISLQMQGTWVLSLVQKIPYAVEQLNPEAMTTEHVGHSFTETLVPASPLSATREAIAMRSLNTVTKSSPYSLQLEKTQAKQ